MKKNRLGEDELLQMPTEKTPELVAGAVDEVRRIFPGLPILGLGLLEMRILFARMTFSVT